MDEVWDHDCPDPREEPAQWASVPGTLVVEARPPGSFETTTTTLTALDTATGEVRWREACAPVGLNQAVTADGDLLVVLHTAPEPWAIGYDLTTGSERWRLALGGEPRGVAVRGPDVVVVAGSMVRRITRDGQEVARRRVAGSALTTLALTHDGDVVTTNGRGRTNILRLSGPTLEVVWGVRVPGTGWTYRNPPLVSDDAVFFHSSSLWAIVVDLASGEVRWRKKKAEGRGGTVLEGPGEPEASVLWGTDALARVRARDGKVLWRAPRVVAVAAAPEPGRVVVARRDDEERTFARGERVEVGVEVLDAATGSTLGAVDLGAVPVSWVEGDLSRRLFAVVDGVVVSGLQDGRVRAFGLD